MGIPQSGLNVLMGLTGDGLNRLEEAEKWAAEELAKGNMAANGAIGELRRRVAEDRIDCDCQECGSWDGLHRR